TGATTLTWTASGRLDVVEVHVGSPGGTLFARTGLGTWSLATGSWVGDGTVFYLQDVTGGLPLISLHTLATITVHTNTSCQPTGAITTTPNPIQVCDGTGLGVTTLIWTSTGISTVEA